MPRDDAAYAANWRNVLLADAALGAVIAAGGTLLLFAIPALGAMLMSGGIVYDVAVVRRARKWALMRRQAGLKRR